MLAALSRAMRASRRRRAVTPHLHKSGPLAPHVRGATRSRSVGGVSHGEIRAAPRAGRDGAKLTYSSGHASFVLHCPFCEKGAKTERSMFVNKTTGGVVCSQHLRHPR